MSIEQTNQLISLMLNSALMMLLSAGLLGGAWLRQDAFLRQIHRAKSRYQRLTRCPSELDVTSTLSQADSLTTIKANFKRLRDHRLQLKRQYQWAQVGMLVLHAALILFGMSLLCLSLRSLFDFDSLIATSLVLFTWGSVGLIAGLSCTLMALAKGERKNGSPGRRFDQLRQQVVWRYQKLTQKRKTKATPHSEPG